MHAAWCASLTYDAAHARQQSHMFSCQTVECHDYVSDPDILDQAAAAVVWHLQLDPDHTLLVVVSHCDTDNISKHSHTIVTVEHISKCKFAGLACK